MSTTTYPTKHHHTPSRVRHNPYAASPSSPTGTPSTTALKPSSPPASPLSASFTTPLTPGIAAAPWPAAAKSPPPADLAVRESSFATPQTSDIFTFAPPPAMQLNADAPAFAVEAGFYGGVDMYQPAYDSVDPAVAVMMYNAASAAANAAAAGTFDTFDTFAPHFPQASSSASSRPARAARGNVQHGTPVEAGMTPTFEDLQRLQGTLVEQARSASGSSFIQAAVKDSNDPRCLELVWAELSAALGDLLLDAHGCYVIKTLLERLPPQQIAYVLQSIAADEQLGFSVCTHSLHTRRVVQHIIENVDGGFLCDLMSRHCADVAMTQQGCIVMQRAMDNAPPSLARDRLFNAISANLIAFAKDPFANYVVQHLMEVGERSETADSMWKAFRGRIVELACNKFASNVIEKCLFHCTADVQHNIIVEMYSSGPQVLYNMLQDSFGNYIIQSSIALATFRDISFIDERLRPVLHTTPYGHKIEGRLDRRLKGKPVTARGPTPSTPHPSERVPRPAQGNAPPQRQRRDKVPAGEVPW